MRIAACVKWVDLRPEIDPLTGSVSTDERTAGISAADSAAVEVALGLADAWGAELTVLCAAAAGADRMLRDLLSTGVDAVSRVDVAPDAPSEVVAAAPMVDGF